MHNESLPINNTRALTAEQIGLFDAFAVDDGRVIIQRPQGSITQRDLLIAATGLSKQLSSNSLSLEQPLSLQPIAPHYVINLCSDRYHFIVGFCAALMSSQTNLLPSNRQPHTIAELLVRYPDAILLVDESTSEFGDVKCINITTSLAVLPEEYPVTHQPMIAAEHIAAIVFTSGSTGQPTAIEKPWRTFVGTTRLLVRRLLAEHVETGSNTVSIVATVPPQHMYGLEMTVMMALQGAVIVYSGQPFFPEDIAVALSQTAAPRILVTTPVHLAAVVKSGVKLPKLAGVISATAPLSDEVAAVAETFLNCPVMEIFGCSEAGSLASRQTTSGSKWTLLDSMTVALQGDKGLDAKVCGAHLIADVPLQDRVEIIDNSHFRFLGRSGDMLNVAGKRASLADLGYKLQHIEGVDDAVCFLPENNGITSKRPAALVVSELSERHIMSALALLIDPVFLPRPLKKVAAIPRNTVGKIPHDQLQGLLKG